MTRRPMPLRDEPDDQALMWCLLAVLAWAPLPLASIRVPFATLLMTLLCALAIGMAWAWRRHGGLARERLRQFAWPLGILLALSVWMTLQAMPLPETVVRFLSPEAWAVQQGVTERFTLSLEPAITRFYAGMTWAYTLAFGMTVLLLRDRKQIDRFAMGIVVLGVSQAVLAMVLYSVQARYQLFFFEVNHDRTKGTFGYHNHFAGYMELCLSVGIGLMLGRLVEGGSRARNWRDRMSQALTFLLSDKMRLRLMLVVMVIALVLTRSRMGNTAFFVALLVTGLVALLLTRRNAPAMVTLIVSLIVIDVAVVGSVVGLERVMERVQGTSLLIEDGGSQESVEQRQMAAEYTLDLIKDFPVAGTGAGTYYGSFIRYRSPGTLFFDHAHNDYAELLADLGAVGFGLLGALVLSTAWVCLRTLAKRRSGLPRGIAFGVTMAMVAIAIHSTVDFNLQTPAVALTLIVILAMGWASWGLPSGRTDTSMGS